MRWGNLHNIECSCSCSSVTVSPAVVTVFNVVPVCCKDYIICCFVPVIVVKFDVAAIKEDSVIIQLHLMIYTPSTLLPSQQTPSIPGATSRFYTITKQGGYGPRVLDVRRVVVSFFCWKKFKIKLVPGTKFRVGVREFVFSWYFM